MKSEDKSVAQLRALLRRPQEGRGPALFDVDPDTALKVLMMPRELMIKRQIALGQAAGLLPQEPLSQERKAQLRRLVHPRLSMCVRAYRDALEAASQIEGFRGPDVSVMRSIHTRMGIFEKMRRGSAAALNDTLDTRLLLRAFSSYVLYAVGESVLKELADPGLPADQRAQMRDAFARLLAFREQLTLRAQHTRAENKAALADARAEADALEGDLLIKHVAGAIKRGEPVPTDQVARAAALWEEREQAKAAKEGRKAEGKGEGRQRKR
jgi:hypothetical protein